MHKRFPSLCMAVILLAGTFHGASARLQPGNCIEHLQAKKVLVLTVSGDNGAGPRLAALDQIKEMSVEIGFRMGVVGLPYALTDALLAEYDVIVFNYVAESHLPRVFPEESKRAFMRWLKRGNRGYVGYNSSGANEWDKDEWRDYQDSVTGMRYQLHGSGTPIGTLEINQDPEIRNHPILKGMPPSYTTIDEWYEYRSDSKIFDPAWNWKVMYYLAKVGEPRFPAPPAHPVAWFREDANATRYFYTTLAQTREVAQSNFFGSLLLRALEYTAAQYCDAAVLAPVAPDRGALLALGRELRVDLDGAYDLSVWSPTGGRLYSAGGSGKRTFRPAALRKPGLYVVKVESRAATIARKVMVH